MSIRISPMERHVVVVAASAGVNGRQNVTGERPEVAVAAPAQQTNGARQVEGVSWSSLGAQQESERPVAIDEQDNRAAASEVLVEKRKKQGRKLTSGSLEFELQRLKMHEKLLLNNKQKLIDHLRGLDGSDAKQQQQQQTATPPSGEPPMAAVECRNLNYQTGLGVFRRSILHNLELTVPEGSIYGLLGPSGCGKTTLLRCVAGRLEPAPNSHVRVFGFRPNEPGSQIPGRAIGYMPQETSVYEEFTIDETLTYFGRINGMRARLLSARIDFLLKFLHLPPKGRLVKSLSGGQKRRVSLAVALVHAPPLLILDEPTVGVDPLLRQTIWNYLATLASSDHTTIIITTHYIEEARQAHVVGLMRQGRLLAEAEPNELMRAANLTTLESVFLKLCVTTPTATGTGTSSSDCEQFLELQTAEMSKAAAIVDDSATSDLAGGAESSVSWSGGSSSTLNDNNKIQEEDLNLASSEFISASALACKPMERGQKYVGKQLGWCSWSRVLMAVTWKNYLRLRRNPPVLVFEFILPAFQVILFCLCIGGPPFDIPLAVVNDEIVPQASGLFLNALNPTTFKQMPYANLSDALESVKRGHTWAAVHIPRGYTHNLNDRLLHPADVANETLTNGTISIYPDLTNLHLALAIEGAFKEAFVKFSRDSLEILGYEPQLAELPIRMAQPIYGHASNSTPTATSGYLEFMAPGVVISITYVMATGLTALAFILEKRDGLLERSQISGVSTAQILFAHSLLQVIVMVLQIGLVLLVTFQVFHVPSEGPFVLIALLVLLQGCTGMAFGLLISAVCSEENAAIMMLVGTFYINLILAGIMWPIEAMPRWLRPLSYAQPQTLPIIGLRDVMARGWSLNETSVQLAFLTTILWLHVFLIGAGLCMRYIK